MTAQASTYPLWLKAVAIGVGAAVGAGVQKAWRGDSLPLSLAIGALIGAVVALLLGGLLGAALTRKKT